MFIFTGRLPTHQITIQHFSANLKRFFREIIVSFNNSFSYFFYWNFNVVHYHLSTYCAYSPLQLLSLFSCPESFVHNDVNPFSCKVKCKISRQSDDLCIPLGISIDCRIVSD